MLNKCRNGRAHFQMKSKANAEALNTDTYSQAKCQRHFHMPLPIATTKQSLIMKMQCQEKKNLMLLK